MQLHCTHMHTTHTHTHADKKIFPSMWTIVMINQGCSQDFQRGVRVKKICKDGAKARPILATTLLTSTLLDRADSLSGCSRAISLSSRAISSSSSWPSLLLPRQEPLVSVSGSGESRSLHSSSPRQQHSAKKHQCEAGTNWKTQWKRIL